MDNNIEDIIEKAMKGGTDIVLGDKIDNRGGTIIKHIEHYHAAGADDVSSAEPVPAVAAIEEAEVIAPKELQERELSRFERITNGIRLIRECGIIQNNYEFQAVRQVILDKKILPVLSNNDFVRLLAETAVFDESLLPTANNLKAYTVKGKFPDWIVEDKKYDVTMQFVRVARKFLEGYSS